MFEREKPKKSFDYEVELQKKRELLQSLFDREIQLNPNPHTEHYRNRMDFICTPKAIGMRQQGKWDKVINVEESILQDKELNEIYKQIRTWVQENNIPCYDIHTKQGFLRYMMLRKGDGIQVTLTTKNDGYQNEIQKLHKQLSIPSLIWTINTAPTDKSVGKLHTVFGDSTIPITFGGKHFHLDPYTFFQTSPHMAQEAIEHMRSFVPADGVLYDLYCGVGVLGICLAKGHVVGVDNVKQSIDRARENAERNNISAEYYCSPVEAWIAAKKLDTVIVDPPRPGLGVAAISLLVAKPKRILYLSCNPKTQKRDIDVLSKDYEVTHMEAFDFFPRTPHIECFAVLDRIE